MKKARKQGFKILAGSDPLPVKEEEKYLGSYASFFQGHFNMKKPVTCMRGILKNKNTQIKNLGKRNGTLESILRIKSCSTKN